MPSTTHDDFPLRLAVIGAGFIGRTHLKAIAAEPGAEIAAIADPLPAAGEVAAAYGVDRFDDYRTMLDAVRPDGVVIATPTELHLEPTLAALEAGAHVLLEKPIASSNEEAGRIVAGAEAAGRHVLIGHHRRHYPLLARAREVIGSGEIGNLVTVSGQWTLKKIDAYYAADWRKRRAAGPVLTNLIHELDTLRYVCGEVTSVQAMVSNIVRGFEKEDAAVILLGFANGAIGTMTISDGAVSPWAWEFATGENPVFPASGQNTHRFVGTTGALEFPGLAIWRHAGKGEGWHDPMEKEFVPFQRVDPYERQCAHFCDVIRGQAEPLIPAADAARTLAATLAVFDAAESGRRVML